MNDNVKEPVRHITADTTDEQLTEYVDFYVWIYEGSEHLRRASRNDFHFWLIKHRDELRLEQQKDDLRKWDGLKCSTPGCEMPIEKPADGICQDCQRD